MKLTSQDPGFLSFQTGRARNPIDHPRSQRRPKRPLQKQALLLDVAKHALNQVVLLTIWNGRHIQTRGVMTHWCLCGRCGWHYFGRSAVPSDGTTWKSFVNTAGPLSVSTSICLALLRQAGRLGWLQAPLSGHTAGRAGGEPVLLGTRGCSFSFMTWSQ